MCSATVKLVIVFTAMHQVRLLLNCYKERPHQLGCKGDKNDLCNSPNIETDINTTIMPCAS